MQPTLQMRDTWTFEDLGTLDLDDWRRYEIIDGALLVSPSTNSCHEYISARLRSILETRSNGEFLVLGPMGVGMPRSYLIPDLFVMLEAKFRSVAKFEPEDAELVVEIESPGSMTTDRVLKPAKYAQAGIRNYWRIEAGPVRLAAYALPAGSDVYVQVGTWGVGETAELTAPFPVSIEIARLQPPPDR